MTATQILAFGTAYICTPGPHDGWDHDIQDDLGLRDYWHRRVMDSAAGTEEHRYALYMRRGVEIRIGTRLGLDYRTRGQH
ncbi:hypothetical protein ACPC54_23860 [Kitasatospora sp. NPDC094028]